MATTQFDWRPSALPAACPSSTLPQAQAHVLGTTAVVTPPRVPTSGDQVSTTLVKINNYIGTPAAAAAEGAVMSGPVALASAVRVQRVGADTAKGFNARGIPPRGRRWV